MYRTLYLSTSLYLKKIGQIMSWQIEIPLIVRTLISDLADTPTSSDDRLQQTIVVAASYVQREMNFDTEYDIDLVNLTITPDPAVASTRDEDFIGFSALRAGCFLDQSTFRDKAKPEGIKPSLRSPKLDVSGSLSDYKTILDQDPMLTYLG